MSLSIIHISDTHLRDFKVSSADILVHSGDALNYGNLEELVKFKNQLKDIKDNFKHIIFTPGNHDWIFEENFDLACTMLKEDIPNIHVLHNSSVEIDGVKFYGSSDQPEFCSWAFNKPFHELLHSYANIPDNVNVLITHCPPKGIRDFLYNGSTVGSSELNIHLPRLKQLKAHLFGHIHYAYGVSLIDGVQYSNAALCNEQYCSVNEPIEILL